jgi:hypothetical protein
VDVCSTREVSFLLDQASHSRWVQFGTWIFLKLSQVIYFNLDNMAMYDQNRCFNHLVCLYNTVFVCNVCESSYFLLYWQLYLLLILATLDKNWQ